ncbi:MAG: dihydrolipoyl dehydrogenase [Lactobacillaceae bacterium]|jgi:dihydrolipoamide dehydrogenase|nr:dihydrolipoyl dehydrogenase [Lactobacillaceae bacterium]
MVVGAQATPVGTLILGSGPGGYVAAIRAAELGQKVTIVERDFIGGICLNVGCIPSKALIQAGHIYQHGLHENPMGITFEKPTIDFAKTQDWKQHQVVERLTGGVEMLLKKHKVDIVRGAARFTDNETVNVIDAEGNSHLFSFDSAIVATGSRPVEMPGFAFKDRVIDSTGALALPEIPKKLTIIGGGVIAAELGNAYANFGTEVTIIIRSDKILKGFDREMVKLVLDDFKAKGVTVITNAKFKEATQTDTAVTVHYELDGAEQALEADYCLVSTGRRPNTDAIGLNQTDIKVSDRGLIEVDAQQRTSVKHIFAIGDIVAGPGLAHKASFEAKVAAAVIAEQAVIDDHIAMPEVAYTDPELATVGMTLAEAKESGAKVAKFPFAANGRAISMTQTAGFIRLISDATTDALLGAQIAGPSASDLISELALAIENGLTTEDISLTIHPHPSLGEAVMDAAELADGLPIHV